MLGYVKLAVNEGGEIVYGEGKEPSLELPSPHTEVERFSYKAVETLFCSSSPDSSHFFERW